MSLVMWIHSDIRLHASQKFSAYLWDFLLHSLLRFQDVGALHLVGALSFLRIPRSSAVPPCFRALDRRHRPCSRPANCQDLCFGGDASGTGATSDQQVRGVPRGISPNSLTNHASWCIYMHHTIIFQYISYFYCMDPTLFSNSSRRQTKNENSKAIHRWLASKSETFRPKLKMPNENLMRVGSERNFPTKLHQLHQLPRQEQHGLRNWCREYWSRFESLLMDRRDLAKNTWHFLVFMVAST